MQSQAEIVNFAQHRATRDRSTRLDEAEEYSFENIADLVIFVSAEIMRSKQKYARLADKSHVCATTISKLANRETKSPRAATVFQVLYALGFDVVVRG
ncbi:XRE family transcriptional regulator [Mesorhizobium sp. M1409]|uniref:XRE family transcriptional regulator n=1 Tax=Mesorhizobium sp. M1409 TaxID=2957100 RepID=UPI003335D93E